MNVYKKCFLRYHYFILDTFHPDILYVSYIYGCCVKRSIKIITELCFGININEGGVMMLI
jgi:hypothetical protein